MSRTDTPPANPFRQYASSPVGKSQAVRRADMQYYDTKLIRKHTWPVPAQMPDGKWERVWMIKLKAPPTVSTAMETLAAVITQEVVQVLAVADRRLEDLQNELVIALEWVSLQDIRAALITEIADWPDELLFAAWRLFEDIDQMLGTIDTIDGQARDQWPPWNLRSWRPE